MLLCVNIYIMNWIFLLYLAPAVLGTQVDFYNLPSAMKFEPPTPISNESLFGFSTTYDLYNKRLIISAPRTGPIGDVYDCDLDRNSCVTIHRNDQPKVPGYNHEYWLGASVKSGTNFITACAPRHTLKHGMTGVAGMYGRCYQRKANDSAFTTETGRPANNNVVDNSEKEMDTLGWSLEIENDNIIIGGPAMFHDRGLAALSLKKNSRLILFPNTAMENRMGNFLNFGYSVVAGNFIHPTQVSYAVSTTYGSYGMGQVYFFNFQKSQISYKFELLTDVDEKKIGSMFGAVMCAAKLSDATDKRSDLLVGAPTFSDNKDSGDHNTGAVYVYKFTKRDYRPEFVRQITGNVVGSCFGSAIVSLGDLNGDKRDEIAIGAPYEGNGAVYVYSGADIYTTSSDLKVLQKIKSPGRKSFGYSLAPLQDYDENGCNELAISAPDDNVVILYKCIAAITLTNLYAQFPPLKNRTKTGQEDFIFRVCMKFDYPLKPNIIFAELSTEVQLKHDHAVLKNPNNDKAYKFNTILNGATSGPAGASLLQTEFCHPIEFTLPKNKDYTMAIQYEITTTLQHSPINMTNINGKVILSDKSVLTNTSTVFAAECAGDECIPNLNMTITANVKRNYPLITGSIEKGNYTITVLNTGEVAYEPCIQFQVTGANLNIQPASCTAMKDVDNMWECTSRSPVKTNATWVLSGMVLDFAALTDETQAVKVAVKLFNRCGNVVPNVEDEYSITLEPDYEGIRISGFTDIGDIVKLTKEDIKVGKQFQHKYKIHNVGVTYFKNLDATVEFKKPDFIKTGNIPVLMRKENSNKECESINVTGDIITAKCNIEISPKGFVHVIIMMGTDPDTLKYEELQKHAKAVNSTLTLHGMSTSASSTIQLWENVVELWMLIVAALVGLLLIVILTIILYKCGCLQRRNKKKLQRLKNDVKRQTMRRSMMMQRESQMPDRQQVLESMEETDESAAVAEESTKSEKK